MHACHESKSSVCSDTTQSSVCTVAQVWWRLLLQEAGQVAPQGKASAAALRGQTDTGVHGHLPIASAHPDSVPIVCLTFDLSGSMASCNVNREGSNIGILFPMPLCYDLTTFKGLTSQCRGVTSGRIIIAEHVSSEPSHC
eukprot:TRINITY_DN71901_c0_g1_i1.p1 TRINITY_DN71901_c0_g1~~TRINITY_DN71901_c0_g1_i1.p1  ORF type:complete len:140 (-),score=19.09 TRINITY_DN71901_c0_g1_i1:139-558(-)